MLFRIRVKLFLLNILNWWNLLSQKISLCLRNYLIEGLLISLTLTVLSLICFFYLFYANIKYLFHHLHILSRNILSRKGWWHTISYHAVWRQSSIGIVGSWLLDHTGHKLRIVDAFIANGIADIWLIFIFLNVGL